MKQLFKDPNIYPEIDLIKQNISETSFNLFMLFTEWLNKVDIKIEWIYYNDAKAWLGKVPKRNKNFGWVSLWDDGFQITIYLPSRLLQEFNDLNISNEIKEKVNNSKKTTKLIPVVLLINNESFLHDAVTVLEYKMKTK